MAIRTINPATGQPGREYETLDGRQVGQAIRAVHRAFGGWRRTSLEERAQLLRASATVLRERASELAILMADEMGKPVTAGRGEIEKCAWVCEHYADHGAEYLAREEVPTDDRRSFVTFEPLGVVLAVMPWNFPFWQAFRFAAPALMAGNTIVLKHASNVPGCALAIEDIFRRAGFPTDVFRTLLVESARVKSIIANPLVSAVTLTGSTEAGRSVAQTAGRHLKKTVLELGGSDAYLVLEDADLEHAANTCAASRLINAGQSCIAAKRFIVVAAVREEFERRLVDAMRRVQTGDPHDEQTTLGPLARHDLRDALHEQVQASIARGACCLIGGAIPEGPGAAYPPTVLTDVRRGMPAFDEELFGPVAAIVPVADEAEAVRTANESRFGLGAAVFTRDIERGTRIAAHELEAGCCCVNMLVQSDPRLPFGGIKDSGYGRELSHFGIREFVNIKSVSVKATE